MHFNLMMARSYVRDGNTALALQYLNAAYALASNPQQRLAILRCVHHTRRIPAL